jgi:hypothetical protein
METCEVKHCRRPISVYYLPGHETSKGICDKHFEAHTRKIINLKLTKYFKK